MSRRPIIHAAGAAGELEVLRAQAGLSVSAWAARLGIPPRTYLRWRAKGSVPRGAALLALARAFSRRKK
jgi:DNA-binding transcriptional regulator YiaG